MRPLSGVHPFTDREPPAHAKPDGVAYDCPNCRDSGWLVQDDGGNGTAYQCPCANPAENPKLLRGRMRLCGMETGEIDAAFEPWDSEFSPKPSWAHRWLVWAMAGCDPEERPEGLEGGQINPRLLTLLGEPGRGKTKTAGVLLRLYIGYGGTGGMWARVPEAFDRVQQERFDRTSEYEQRLKDAKLLVLDELGKEHRANRDLIASTVYEWICYRERRRTITLFTGNILKLGELGDAALESRLASGIYQLMTGEDYRDR
ncbi:MAG: hypothetical protein O7A04_06810 [Acidobacteria bacterium]|nr:hypothetical protein [Acidobacteriota bacterium]